MENYETVKIIGKGSHGDVYLVRHARDQALYVMKKINLKGASLEHQNATFQEVRLLSTLNHPNIVQYHESFRAGDHFCIVMEYCEGGDLYTRLQGQRKTGKYLNEKQILDWFIQILLALQYLHKKHILHRDLKILSYLRMLTYSLQTQNIFLTNDNTIKLGDFGIARILEGARDMATTMCGTPYYMSPEILQGKPYSYASDMWALVRLALDYPKITHRDVA